MAWETEQLKHIAFLQKNSTGGGRKVRYHLLPLMQVQRADGFIALEPLPALTPHTRLGDLYGFDEVQMIDPVGVDKTERGGPLNLTSLGHQIGVRTTQESAS